MLTAHGVNGLGIYIGSAEVPAYRLNRSDPAALRANLANSASSLAFT